MPAVEVVKSSPYMVPVVPLTDEYLCSCPDPSVMVGLPVKKILDAIKLLLVDVSKL